MRRVPRYLPALPLAAVVLLASLPGIAEGQDRTPYQNVISANPFGLLMEWFNAEYERTVTDASTAGIGGSTFRYRNDDELRVRYSNVDLFWRYYPQGTPFEGWSFGAKLGMTRVGEEGSFAGIGFDVNRSWLLGANDNFYVGAGFGLKRLLGTSFDNDELVFIPTFRLVNVGFAF
jgi:hypothetical protein